MQATARFGVLGPLRVEIGGRPVPLGPLKQQLVLATLLCHANRPVPVDVLTEAVWQDDPPRTARKNLQVYVSALRKLLGDEGAAEGPDTPAGARVSDPSALPPLPLAGRAAPSAPATAPTAEEFPGAVAHPVAPVVPFPAAASVPPYSPAAPTGVPGRTAARALPVPHLTMAPEPPTPYAGPESAPYARPAQAPSPTAPRITRESGGYRLRVSPGELDAGRFQDLARSARARATRGEHAAAAEQLRQALELWRGRPLAGLLDSPVVRVEAERLEERCLAGYEDWAEAELAGGSDAAALAEAVADVAERHPLRERLQAARMSALQQAGRPAEALAVYDGHRRLLARELGLAPGPALEARYRTLLAGRATRPAAPARTVLPPDTADFTGRVAQVGELAEAVRGGGRVAVLSGPAGIGKTALAVRVAHLLRAHFPDGRLLVRTREADGSARPHEAVLAELAALAGLDGHAGDDFRGTAARWRDWLAARRVLLILDDVPCEAVVRELLPAEGAGAALVTSRARLAGLAPVHRVDPPPYDVPEALDLLGRIIGTPRLRSDPAAAEAIVTAGGLLPLAVRASGLKLAMLRHLPLREYAARLADPHAVLDELAAGDVAVRPRLDRAWQDLPAPQRAALRRLSRLPLSRPFTLAQAAAALECEEAAALRQLEALILAGPVTSPPRETTATCTVYTQPHLIQLYAREAAAPQGRTAARLTA
ncbi:AfsR/SARP family transcriptional regulator [Actinacidiphila guanduensis]|nr:BTAD domain-containing putative transcriptional regulator [Actinacidiphila guanduensis]